MFEEVWVVPVVLAVAFLLVVVVNGTVLASGVYQVLTGRPSLLMRIVASIRTRLPATPADCVLLGAAQVLQSVAFLIGTFPIALLGAWEILGGPPLPALGRWSALVLVFLAFALLALIIAVVCIAASLALSLRVKYVIDDGSLKVARSA